MDNILSPIATFEIDDNNELPNNYWANIDFCDEINGNVPPDYVYPHSENYMIQSLQSSLENLVNNFDSVISECFNSTEKIDSLSPIPDKYRSCSTLVDKNQIWLSLSGSATMTLNLDWRNFRTFQEFKQAINVSRDDDFVNQNLDLPDDEDLANAMDHHSLVTSSIPSDFEPMKTADEVIEEIDQIMGISNDELNCGDLTSNLDCSEFNESEDALNLRRMILSRSDAWIHDLDKMSMKDLNDVLNELEDSIRDFSSLLVNELAQREDLEDEKEQRDLFIKLIHDVERKQGNKSDNLKPRQLSDISLNESVSDEKKHKRSNSWRSIFSYGSKSNRDPPRQETPVNRISQSSDNINKCFDVSIPIHNHTRMERYLLETFNQMLEAMITSPVRFNQLLTDYILNVYAPKDDFNLSISLEML